MIFSGINSHLSFGFVSRASLLLSGTRLVRYLGSIQPAQKEAEFIVLTSDVPFSVQTPQTEISQATDPGHTVYKLQNVPEKDILMCSKALAKVGFFPQDQLIFFPFVAANHLLRATCYAQHPLSHMHLRKHYFSGVGAGGRVSRHPAPS